MKTLHSADTNGISGRTRKHIVSRLDKAARTAEGLVELLADPGLNASRNDRLEAQAYAALIRGAALFENRSWQPCVASYSVARVIYSALSSATKGDVFKDLLSETIDPSIRYAAYQLKTPRTIPIPVIARKSFPQSDDWLVQQVNDLDPNILRQGEADSQKSAENAPRTLTWRSREVQIEDAAISLAWGRVEEAKARLTDQVSSLSDADGKDIAAAYDDVLTATQDAVDATKEAIDELRGEGAAQSDPRMQSLQITRTAVNFEMISWRIGRNRVLTGDRDGAVENYQTASRKKSKKEPSPDQRRKDETHSRKAAKLRELVALYEVILQSIESIKELPGVAADQTLAGQLDASAKYFDALKYVAADNNLRGTLSLISSLGLSPLLVPTMSSEMPSTRWLSSSTRTTRPRKPHKSSPRPPSRRPGRLVTCRSLPQTPSTWKTSSRASCSATALSFTSSTFSRRLSGQRRLTNSPSP